MTRASRGPSTTAEPLDVGGLSRTRSLVEHRAWADERETAVYLPHNERTRCMSKSPRRLMRSFSCNQL